MLNPSFETRLDQRDPASELVEYKSRTCSGVCCSSALQKQIVEGPLKKRILIREGFAKPLLSLKGEALSSDGSLTAKTIDGALINAGASPSRMEDPAETFCENAVEIEHSKGNPTELLATSLDDSIIKVEDVSVAEYDPYDDYDPLGGTWKQVVLRSSHAEGKEAPSEATVSYEYMCDQAEENLARWGRIRFQDRVFPFVFRERCVLAELERGGRDYLVLSRLSSKRKVGSEIRPIHRSNYAPFVYSYA